MTDVVGVDAVRRWLAQSGPAAVMEGMVGYPEEDFARWPSFDKTSRVASHAPLGVIELMPVSGPDLHGFEDVNGHPSNLARGFQTVTAFGVLAGVYDGYPVFVAEMTSPRAPPTTPGLRSSPTPTSPRARTSTPSAVTAPARLDPATLDRGRVFVEHARQVRVEGEIQDRVADFPVTELWEVLTGAAPGRPGVDEVTVFDSVGFALEDYGALRHLRDAVSGTDLVEDIDLVPAPEDPKELFGFAMAPAPVG